MAAKPEPPAPGQQVASDAPLPLTLPALSRVQLDYMQPSTWFAMHTAVETASNKSRTKLAKALDKVTPEQEVAMPGPVNLLRYGLGRFYYDQGDTTSAKQLCHQAYKACKQHFDSEHVGTHVCMEVAAYSLFDERQFKAAESVFKAAFALRTKVKVCRAPVSTLGLHATLCYCLWRQSKLAEALASLTDAFRMACQLGLLCTNHGRDVAWMLASCLTEKGQPAKAVSVCQRALVGHERVTGNVQVLPVVSCFQEMAKAYQRMGKPELGLVMAQEGLRITQLHLPEDAEVLSCVHRVQLMCHAAVDGLNRGS